VLKVLAGLADGEKYPNLSCDFMERGGSNKQKNRQGALCLRRGPLRRETGSSAASPSGWNSGQGFLQKHLSRTGLRG
jgi:hypothetical protein